MARALFKDFTEIPVKDVIQKHLYFIASYRYGMISNVLTVAGPALKRHIIDARDFGPAKSRLSKVIVVENNKGRYEEQCAEKAIGLSGCWKDLDGNRHQYRYKVEIRCEDVKNSKVERFMDIDLCGNIRTSGKVMKPLLKRQQKLYRYKYKAFIFTFARRGFGGSEEETMKWINNNMFQMLGAEMRIYSKANDIDFLKGSSPHYGSSLWRLFPKFSKRGRIHDVWIYNYRDGYDCPMMTGIIIYK